ncbi:LOW QUALITY PROTEIN: phospholipase A2-like [Pieris rapae]|uniref:LOW QUALITY PROTEIN: phospholipase A2-like n=1 Tax=Pieris rapae TaxID=64459 RepID=UPI001E27B3B5|nr:LOW QUALITY PROTEIN: phospholipase A2-like [Pieris rapae]
MLNILFLFVVIQSAVCWNQNPGVHSETLWKAINPTASEKQPGQKDSFIYPGTKWCGSGSIAKDHDDLGKEVEADKCCRSHDLCPDFIAAGESKHNLKNGASYTRLDCHCDMEFRDCLHKANTSTAKGVGRLYFNYLGTQCYKKDHPIVACKKIQTGIWSNKCLEYELDDTKEPVYQWFDVPKY